MRQASTDCNLASRRMHTTMTATRTHSHRYTEGAGSPMGASVVLLALTPPPKKQHTKVFPHAVLIMLTPFVPRSHFFSPPHSDNYQQVERGSRLSFFFYFCYRCCCSSAAAAAAATCSCPFVLRPLLPRSRPLSPPLFLRSSLA